MTMWQFYAIQDGFKTFHGAGPQAGDAAPSNDEFDSILDRFADF